MSAQRIGLLVCLLPALALVSCSKKNYATQPQYQFKSKDGRPDYSDLHYWAAHPYKWDPSDSVPKPLRKSYRKDSVADVFFLYPTTLTEREDTRANAPIDDSLINAKTDYSTILLQASAFNEQCRIFAPRYRQAHYRTFFSPGTPAAVAAFDTAYSDIKQAFEYYLAHLNNGRPIIIASHSQGTLHAVRLLKEFFEGKDLQRKLVCAYLVGMPTPEDAFTQIPACTDSLSTGCFVGWRSYKKGYEGTYYMQAETTRSVVTNPLLWNTGNGYAPRSLNTGAILMKFNKLVKGVDAQVHHNILWVSKPKFFGSIFLKSKNYHIGDINLFYTNIRENVRKRIGMYWR
jgi:hypothetical protein